MMKLIKKFDKNKNILPSIQIDLRNRNHHIWNNNGSLWLHYTMKVWDYRDFTYKVKRIRKNLKTKSIREARRQRDAIFKDLENS